MIHFKKLLLALLCSTPQLFVKVKKRSSSTKNIDDCKPVKVRQVGNFLPFNEMADKQKPYINFK